MESDEPMAHLLVNFAAAVNESDPAPKTREVIRVVVIGSKAGVRETLQ